jgi:NAD+ diphosphatase
MLDGWTLCPRCGSQLTRGDGVVECGSCGFYLYAHSAITASALPEDDDGRVLLARRAHQPFRGLWDVVGGFLMEGEDAVEGARRETREETGVDIDLGRFLGAWTGDYGGRATLNLFWLGRMHDGELVAADDVAELRWFAADELPSRDALAFDGLISDVLRAWRDEHA